MDKAKAKDLKYNQCYRLLIVFVFFISAVVMFGSGGNIEEFFRDGIIYNRTTVDNYIELLNAEATDNGDKIIAGETGFYIAAEDIKKSQRWRYVEIDVAYLSRDVVEAELSVMDGDMVLLTERIEIKEGSNVIELDWIKGKSVNVIFHAEEETILAVEHIYLRNALLEWNTLRGFFYAVVLTVVFLFILQKVNLFSWAGYAIDRICGLYEMILNRLNFWERIAWKYKKAARTLLFLICIIYGMFSVNINLRKYDIRVYFCLFFLLASLCVTGQRRKYRWNTTVSRHWVLVCFWLMLSDCFVSKSMMWTGYLWLISFGFFIYAWNGMADRLEIVRELKAAVQLSYVGVVIFCILCRPDNVLRYMGPFRNPNMFGFYLIVVLTVNLDALNQFIYTKENKRKLILWMTELISIVFWVWKTQARTSLIAMLVLVFLWFFQKYKRISFAIWSKKQKKIFTIFLICIIPVWMGLQWGISCLPEYFGTAVIMKRDLFLPLSQEQYTMCTPPFFTENVYAAGTNRLWFDKNASLNLISSGRINIWKDYFRELNLIGHAGNAINYSYGAHNLFLGLAYRYGVFALIPFVLMWRDVLLAAWNNMRKKNGDNSYFFMALLFGYCCVAALNDIERPGSYLIWMLAYTMIGYFFYEES